jgi:hypothetical protein
MIEMCMARHLNPLFLSIVLGLTGLRVHGEMPGTETGCSGMENPKTQLLAVMPEQACNRLLEAVEKLILFLTKGSAMDLEGTIGLIHDHILADEKLMAELRKMLLVPLLLRTEKFKKPFRDVVRDRLIAAGLDVDPRKERKPVQPKLDIRKHIIEVEQNLYACDVSFGELSAAGVSIPEAYATRPLRLVFGATIDIDDKTSEKVAYVDVNVELEEWKKLSEAIKRYKESRGEKHDTDWIRCTPVRKGPELTAGRPPGSPPSWRG